MNKYRGRKKTNMLKPVEIKILVCTLIVFISVLLKTTNIGFLVEFRQTISTMINSGTNTEEFISTLGSILTNPSDDESIIETLANTLTKDIDTDEDNSFSDDLTSDYSEVFNWAYDVGDVNSSPIFNDSSFASLINQQLIDGDYEPDVILNVSEQQDGSKNSPFSIPPPDNVSDKIYKPNFKTVNPTTGTLTSTFGYRVHPIDNTTKFHTGTDIANASNTKIMSIADGKVSKVGKSNVFGNYVIIEHKDGFSSFYAHNTKVTVKEGKSVRRGEVISLMGSTGKSTGSHLHFEMRKGGKIISPQNFIEY